MVSKVRHKKRDGTMYLMGERVAWGMEGRDHFDVSILYADIKCQKVSPETKSKVQLQLILLNGDSYVFHFISPSKCKTDRESVKVLLSKMLPMFRRKMDKELEEKNKLLQTDPELFQTYKDLVVEGVLSPEEFWVSHSKKLSSALGSSSASQDVGVSSAFLANVKPQADGCNGLRYNLTADTIRSIFSTYPAVKTKYLQKVPDTLSEKEFWTMFFQSHYFHRERVNTQGNNSKDIFADCVKKDDQDILSLLKLGVNDKFNDLNYLDDEDSANAEGYGSVADPNILVNKGKPSSAHQVQKNIIKRFNYQSAMILQTSAKKKTQQSSDESKKQNGQSSASNNGDGPSPSKKMKLKESLIYDDLVEVNETKSSSLNLQKSERYSHGPTLLNHSHQELNSSNVLEGMKVVTVQCNSYKPRLNQTLESTHAASALSEMTSSRAASLHNDQSSANNLINRILTSQQSDELKKLYVSSSELLRHFWSCFPANTPFLQEKVERMCKSIEKFHTTKVIPFQESLRSQRVTSNVTDHLEEMFQAAYVKFNSWQTKKLTRKL